MLYVTISCIVKPRLGVLLLTGEMRLVNDRMKTIKENATFFNPIIDTLLKPTQ